MMQSSLKILHLKDMAFTKLMMKATPSKALVIRINLVFLAFFLIIYAFLVFKPTTYIDSSTTFVRCSLRECHHKKVNDGVQMKVVLEDTKLHEKRRMVQREKPSFLDEIGMSKKTRIGLLNMDDEDLSDWEFEFQPVLFERVSSNFNL